MRSRESVVEAICNAVSAIAGRPLPVAGEGLALLEGGAALTSVQLIELISTLEHELGLQFEEEDLRMATFASVQSLADRVLVRLGA